MNLSQAKNLLKNPNFVKWFGKSKVVDDTGNPLSVYHGTQGNFDEFKYSNDIGFHFGTPGQASYKTSGNSPGANIMPVYLSIKNPINLSDHVWDTPESLLEGLGKYDTKGTLRKKVLEWNGLKEQWRTTEPILANKSSKTALSDYNNAKKEWVSKLKIKSDEIDNEAQSVLKNAGYDGVIYGNAVEGAGKSYIAFHPTQIKSQFNKGTFDPTNPNILKGATAIAAGSTLLPKDALAAKYKKMESDQALQDAYSPVDMVIAGVTGGATLGLRAISALADPVINYAIDKMLGD